MSLVRISCNSWQVTDENKEVIGLIWPHILKQNGGYYSMQEQVIEIDDIPESLFEDGTITIKPIKKVRFQSNDVPNLNHLKNISEVKEFVKNINQIVMPGYELLEYRSIMVLENCCTYEIQTHLNNDWRIIAVLPQSGNRRPDYILVHKNKEK